MENNIWAILLEKSWVMKMIKKESKILEMKSYKQLNTIAKLRIIIISIFVLSTLSIVMAFISDFIVSVLLLLISYSLVFALMIKLFIIKKI